MKQELEKILRKRSKWIWLTRIAGCIAFSTFILITNEVQAQNNVGISTVNPDPSAILDLSATNNDIIPEGGGSGGRNGTCYNCGALGGNGANGLVIVYW